MSVIVHQLVHFLLQETSILRTHPRKLFLNYLRDFFCLPCPIIFITASVIFMLYNVHRHIAVTDNIFIPATLLGSHFVSTVYINAEAEAFCMSCINFVHADGVATVFFFFSKWHISLFFFCNFHWRVCVAWVCQAAKERIFPQPQIRYIKSEKWAWLTD